MTPLQAANLGDPQAAAIHRDQDCVVTRTAIALAIAEEIAHLVPINDPLHQLVPDLGQSDRHPDIEGQIADLLAERQKRFDCR